MTYIEELAALISVRNFLVNCTEVLTVKLSREQIKGLQSKLSQVEQRLVDMVLKFDPTQDDISGIARQFTSSVSADEVMKAIDTLASKTEQTEQAETKKKPAIKRTSNE